MNSQTVSLDTDRDGRMRLAEQLDILAMPPRTRRNVVKRMAGEIRKTARTNIRTQTTTSGAPMSPRKRNRARRKMLRGLGPDMKIYPRGEDAAAVTWGSPVAAKIADRHQYGKAEYWTGNQARKVYGVPDYQAPATRAQAKALLAEGFRLRVRKKKGKGCTLRRVNIAWIRSNLSQGKAGLVLRLIRDGSWRGTPRWEIKPAARPFLGPAPGDEEKLLNGLARQAIADIRNR